MRAEAGCTSGRGNPSSLQCQHLYGTAVIRSLYRMIVMRVLKRCQLNVYMGYENEMQRKNVKSVIYIELAGVFQVVEYTRILLPDMSVYLSVETFNALVMYTRTSDHRVRTSKLVHSIPYFCIFYPIVSADPGGGTSHYLCSVSKMVDHGISSVVVAGTKVEA